MPALLEIVSKPAVAAWWGESRPEWRDAWTGAWRDALFMERVVL